MTSRRLDLTTLSFLFLCSALAVQAATLVRAPYVQNVQADHATILWTTREPGTGAVVLSDGRSARSAAAQVRAFLPPETHLTSAFYQYQVELTGLNSSTTYQYSVSVDGETLFPAATQGATTHFTTEGPGKFSFLVFGDSGSGSTEELQLATLSAEPGLSLVLHTGDLAYEDGTFEQFDARYFAPYAGIMQRVPFFPTPGNHEYYTDNAAPYLAVNVLPEGGVAAKDRGRYYSFDWGDAHFVSVDSNLLDTPSASPMLAWLDQDLKRTQKFWKIVYFHHTPYPSGHHLDDPLCLRARAVVNPIAERNGVQLVLSGHEHSYQRSLPLSNGAVVEAGTGTTYIVTGGGGGVLQSISKLPTTAVDLDDYHYLRADLDGPQLIIRAIGLDGSEIDRVTLAQKPLLSNPAVVNAGDFTAGIASGSLVSIFGQNLAIRSTPAGEPPLPQTLTATSVTVGAAFAPLLYVSPKQINAQIPYGVHGQTTIHVQTPNGRASATILVSDVAPAILWISSGATLLTAAHPANPGDSITVFGTGLGPVGGGVNAGNPAPSPAISTADAVQVLIGGIVVQPSFAGLAPGFAGLYEVNLTVPPGLDGGNYPLQVVVGGVKSGASTLSVAPEPNLQMLQRLLHK